MRKVLIPIAAVLLMGAAEEKQYDMFPETGPETEQFLAKRFPAGTPSKEIEKYLITQEFDCADKSDDRAFGQRAKAGTYVFCERTVAYGFLLGKRWQIALVKAKGGKVETIYATYEMVGR